MGTLSSVPIAVLETLDGADEYFWFQASVQTQTSLYRSGTVNSKSFVGKVLLRIKWKFELTYAL